MRLCLYTATFLPTLGGAELVLHHLAAGFVQRGHAVTVLAPKLRGLDNRLAAPYRLSRYARPSSKRWGVRQVLVHLLAERLRSGMDLLHCHGAYPPAYVGGTFKRWFGLPMVVRPHGSDILPGEWIRRVPRLEARLRQGLAAADLVIAQSGALEEEIRALGVPSERVKRIPNGLHVGDFAVEPGESRGTPYLAAIGSLTRKKGFDLLLRAFTLVRGKHPNVALRIAGAGPEEGMLRRLITDLGLEHAVELVGVLTGREKVAFLQQALLLVSSARREPFATANLEAMAAGLPIVATRVGGNPEIVRDGVTGVLVPPDDPAALADAILALLGDAEERRRMSAAAREHVKAYDWSVIIERYLEAYAGVLPAG